MPRPARKKRTADDILRGAVPVPVGGRDPNGALIVNDINAKRIKDPDTGKLMTVRRPPAISAEFQEGIKGLSVAQAIAALRQRDIDSGDFYRIWEAYKGKALGGDREIQKDYLDRVGGKAVQTVAVAANIRLTLGDEEKKILSGLMTAFGMREMVDTTAREVA